MDVVRALGPGYRVTGFFLKAGRCGGKIGSAEKDQNKKGEGAGPPLPLSAADGFPHYSFFSGALRSFITPSVTFSASTPLPA